MIVAEEFENGVNIYVDGFVFTKLAGDTAWHFGDGNDAQNRWQQSADRRSMPLSFFKDYYAGLCDAASGADNKDWTYRYHVVAMQGNASPAQIEIMNDIEQQFIEADITQDRAKCEHLLKERASLGQIRMYGLAIRRYIQSKDKSISARIVYQMDELTPNEVDALIPAQVLASAVHRAKAPEQDFMRKFFG